MHTLRFAIVTMALMVACNSSNDDFKVPPGGGGGGDGPGPDGGSRDDAPMFDAPPTASADLGISLTAAPSPVDAGTALTYTVTVTNAATSQDAAGHVVVTDTLPTGATYQSAGGTGWSCANASGVVTCTLPTLAKGSTATFTISVAAPTVGGMIASTARVRSDAADSVTNNNMATASSMVRAPADLALAVVASPDPVAAQSTLTYTIAVTNLGPGDARMLVVTDQLPDGNVAFVSATGLDWSCAHNGQTVTCARDALLVGAAPTITIKITTPAMFTSLSDTATVTAASADNDFTNNSKTITTQGATPLADLSVAIADSPDPALAGAKITYTIATHNAGPQAATGVSVTITLPLNGGFFSVVGMLWVCPAPVSGKIVCTHAAAIDSMTDAANISVVWTAPSPGGFSIVTSASVDATSTDPSLANNTATNDTTVLP